LADGQQILKANLILILTRGQTGPEGDKDEDGRHKWRPYTGCAAARPTT